MKVFLWTGTIDLAPGSVMVMAMSLTIARTAIRRKFKDDRSWPDIEQLVFLNQPEVLSMNDARAFIQ